ncbi:MAG: hypothetical protein LUE29_06010 [Lachnospiraceae bacterium]|nr:hypothetical protein [Lachnospiraceae bacterium]
MMGISGHFTMIMRAAAGKAAANDTRKEHSEMMNGKLVAKNNVLPAAAVGELVQQPKKKWCSRCSGLVQRLTGGKFYGR